MKKVIKRIVNIVIDIIVILILAVSVLIVTLSLTSKSSGVPNIFGIAPLSVLTGSMEDTINTGDLIFCEVTDDPSYEYKKGGGFGRRTAGGAGLSGCLRRAGA